MDSIQEVISGLDSLDDKKGVVYGSYYSFAANLRWGSKADVKSLPTKICSNKYIENYENN